MKITSTLIMSPSFIKGYMAALGFCGRVPWYSKVKPLQKFVSFLINASAARNSESANGSVLYKKKTSGD